MSGIRPGTGVASVTDDDGIVYVAKLPDGPVVVLEGVGALIWQQLAENDDTSLSERVAASLVEAPADLDAQIDVFLRSLSAHGLLTAPTD